MMSWSLIGKIGTFFGVLLMLSLGLCGYSLSHSSTDMGTKLAGISLIGIVLGILGLAVTVLMTVIEAISSSSRKPPLRYGVPPRPQSPLQVPSQEQLPSSPEILPPTPPHEPPQ